MDARTAFEPPPAPQHSETRREDYRPPDWLVPEVALDVRLDMERSIVTSRLVVTRNGTHQRPLRLDGQDLETRRILVDGVRGLSLDPAGRSRGHSRAWGNGRRAEP